MHRRLIPLLLAALALSSCAAEAPAASKPAATVTVTATPMPSATSNAGEGAFLTDVRMKARTLTPELVDDEALLRLGEAMCGPGGGEIHKTNARVNQGFTYDEIEVIETAGKRHLC